MLLYPPFKYQPHPFNMPLMHLPTLHGIDSRRIHTGMSQNVCQPYYILLHTIIRPREKMPQIVRKHLLIRHARYTAKLFHFSPNIRSVHRSSASSLEDGAAFYFGLFQVLFQKLAQSGGKKNGTVFPLASDLRATSYQSIDRNEAKLGHANSRRADSLHQTKKAAILLPRRGS